METFIFIPENIKAQGKFSIKRIFPRYWFIHDNSYFTEP